MTRQEILNAAAQATCERQNTYSEPENSFNAIADLWSAFLDYHITPRNVALMLILLKIARVNEGVTHVDNRVDIAGYAACGGEIETGFNQVVQVVN